MTDFYSQNRCVCSTRSHGPLLCAFCLSFHFKRALTRYNIIVMIQLSVYHVTCNVGTYNVVDTNVISVLFYYVMIVLMRIPACLRI